MGYQDHDAVTKIAFDDGYKHGYADAVDDHKQGVHIDREVGVHQQAQSCAGDTMDVPRSLYDLNARLDRYITQTDARLDRLVDHVNREVGVAQDVPFHSRLGDAGLDSKVPVGLALDEAFRRINALESRPVEHPEWFTGVDRFIGRVDKELEEHRRELHRIVHGTPGKR